jgi:transcriptional regulator with XRE-family HTH domain
MTEKQISVVVGENVRGFRERLGVSQEQLAELCEVHRTYVGRLERGERAITTTTLVRIAKGLGIDKEYFVLLIPKAHLLFKKGEHVTLGRAAVTFNEDYGRSLPKWITD